MSSIVESQPRRKASSKPAKSPAGHAPESTLASNPKGGRPKKAVGTKHTRSRTIKYTESDDALLMARATKAGMTVAEFVRHMSLNGSLVVRTTVIQAQLDEDIIDRLLSHGQDLNRIAKLLNATERYEPAGLDTALRLNKRLMKQLKPLNVLAPEIGLQLSAIGNNLQQIKRRLLAMKSFVPQPLAIAIKTNGQLLAKVKGLHEVAA